MRKFLRRFFPTPDSLFQYRVYRWMKPVLGHPRLWHMHRRSVALGVAIGMITGLIPGPVQMLMAILIAILLRANVPAAAAATWFTNPLTFVPLYILAYHIGALVTGVSAPLTIPPDLEWSWAGLRGAIPLFFAWVSAAGSTLLIGLVIEAALLAAGGYALVMIAWRVTVTAAWRHRTRSRAQKLK